MSTDKQDPIEAEVIQSQAVAVRQQSGAVATMADMEQAFAMAVRQRELLSDYIKKQLVPGKHFYQRGDQKPSLAKEGAEIILLPHNLAPDYEIVSGPETPPNDDKPYQITVKCTLRRKGDPTSFAGSGMGSAGSEKGYWEKNGPNKGKWMYQPRQTDKYLCHNATLKMAQKSAMISATINSTAASEFFTQDMEPGESASTGAPAAKPAPPPVKKAKPELKLPTEATREWMIKELKAGPAGPNRGVVSEYFFKIGQLLETEAIENLPLRFVPFSKQELEVLVNCLSNFEAGGDAVRAFEPHGDADDQKPIQVPRDKEPAAEGDEWRAFPMPFGKDAGTIMEEVDKKVLFGWWANYTVETEYKGKPKKPETIAKDRKFRAMLDLAGEHYKFEKKD